MNDTLKAVIIEVSEGNIRDHRVEVRGAFGLFPEDSFGGRDQAVAATPLTLFVGFEPVETDIHETRAIFRERGAFRRFFESEHIVEHDLILIERTDDRCFPISKASKRALRYYL